MFLHLWFILRNTENKPICMWLVRRITSWLYMYLDKNVQSDCNVLGFEFDEGVWMYLWISIDWYIKRFVVKMWVCIQPFFLHVWLGFDVLQEKKDGSWAHWLLDGSVDYQIWNQVDYWFWIQVNYEFQIQVLISDLILFFVIRLMEI